MSTKFSYTNRDIEAARKEGLSQIPIMSGGDWTDLNPSDPGIVILDYVHALTDMIQFYQDHQALETYMETARERRNIMKIARQMSYKVKSSTGASTEVDFYTEFPLNNNVVIPQGTVVTAALSNEILYFSTVEEVILYAGQTIVSVSVREGTQVSTTYQGTGFSELSQTQDPRNQYVIITDEGADMDTVTISDDSGFVWQPIDFIFYADADERRYELSLTEDNQIKILFGNGKRGKVPGELDTLSIKYMKTRGSRGNVGANKIKGINTGLSDSQGSAVNINVRNTVSASGGTDPQGNQAIKENAPRSLKTLWRAVTSSDFEVLAKEVPGVATVKALDITNSPEMCLHHEVKLLIVPEGGSTPSKYLKDRVFQYLYPRSIPPVVIQMIDPVYVDIDFNFTVGYDRRYMIEEVDNNIRRVLDEYFLEVGNSFSQTIRYTTLISLISSVNGVKYVSKFSLTEDVTLNKIQLPRLGTIDITFIEEG